MTIKKCIDIEYKRHIERDYVERIGKTQNMHSKLRSKTVLQLNPPLIICIFFGKSLFFAVDKPILMPYKMRKYNLGKEISNMLFRFNTDI